jgi:hypothetical protein
MSDNGELTSERIIIIVLMLFALSTYATSVKPGKRE